jgi:hypothetical protein
LYWSLLHPDMHSPLTAWNPTGHVVRQFYSYLLNPEAQVIQVVAKPTQVAQEASQVTQAEAVLLKN